MARRHAEVRVANESRRSASSGRRTARRDRRLPAPGDARYVRRAALDAPTAGRAEDAMDDRGIDEPGARARRHSSRARTPTSTPTIRTRRCGPRIRAQTSSTQAASAPDGRLRRLRDTGIARHAYHRPLRGSSIKTWRDSRRQLAAPARDSRGAVRVSVRRAWSHVFSRRSRTANQRLRLGWQHADRTSPRGPGAPEITTTATSRHKPRDRVHHVQRACAVRDAATPEPRR